MLKINSPVTKPLNFGHRDRIIYKDSKGLYYLDNYGNRISAQPVGKKLYRKDNGWVVNDGAKGTHPPDHYDEAYGEAHGFRPEIKSFWNDCDDF